MILKLMKPKVVARQTLLAVLTVVAIFFIWTHLDEWAIIASFLWGPLILTAMRNGMHSAPKENWNRKTGSITGVVVITLLGALIFAPCVLIWCWFGFTPAIAAAWLVLVTMSLTFQISNKLFGSILNPNRDEHNLGHGTADNAISHG